MRSAEFRQTRQLLRITQDQLAERLRTTRRSIIRYEDGSRRTPGMAEVALQHLASAQISLACPMDHRSRMRLPREWLLTHGEMKGKFGGPNGI